MKSDMDADEPVIVGQSPSAASGVGEAIARLTALRSLPSFVSVPQADGLTFDCLPDPTPNDRPNVYGG